MDRPRDILNSLQHILASFRGDNKNLLLTLYEKFGNLKPDIQMLIEPSCRSIEELDDRWQNENTTSEESALNLETDPLATGNVERLISPTYYRTQQITTQFDRSWFESLSLTSPSRNLFEQLQNFNGSFSPGESSVVMDQLLSSREWDGTTELG